MTRCHFGREVLAPSNSMTVPDAPGVRACLAHLLLASINRAATEALTLRDLRERAAMKSTNAQSDVSKFDQSIIVSHGGVGPLGRWYRVEAFKRGELVYARSGATSREEALQKAQMFLDTNNARGNK